MPHGDRVILEGVVHVDHTFGTEFVRVYGNEQQLIASIARDDVVERHELERAEEELHRIDELLARRPAIDHLPDRLNKIQLAIKRAGEADKWEARAKIAEEKLTEKEINLNQKVNFPTYTPPRY